MEARRTDGVTEPGCGGELVGSSVEKSGGGRKFSQRSVLAFFARAGGGEVILVAELRVVP